MKKYNIVKLMILIILIIISILFSFETAEKIYRINNLKKVSNEITKSDIAPFSFRVLIKY